MEWNDAAIVLSTRKFGENASLIKLLGHKHGLYAGLVRGAGGKRNRSIYQPGNTVIARWKARLPEHLGNISAELVESCAALFLEDALRLTALSAVCAMVEASLSERQEEEKVFLAVQSILMHLKQDNPLWQKEYVLFEIMLLSTLGVGIDLSECGATGATENLIYISPKSGRAICAAAGEPYKDKLFSLPPFLLDHNNPATAADISNCLQMTGYFLEKLHFLAHHLTIPAVRSRLIGMLCVC